MKKPGSTKKPGGNVEKLGTVKTLKKKVVKQTGFFQISNRAKNYFLNIFLKS